MEVVGAVDKLISGGGSAALRANWPKAGGEAPRLLTPNSTEGKHPPNSTRHTSNWLMFTNNVTLLTEKGPRDSWIRQPSTEERRGLEVRAQPEPII